MDAVDEAGQRVAAVMKALYDEIPARLGINALLTDAYHRLMVATDGMDAEARRMVVSNGVAEALREIATYAVEQFTKRTGDPFQWADEQDPPVEESLMTFAVDAKGNVVFGDGVTSVAQVRCSECAGLPPGVLCRSCLERLAEVR